MERDYAIFPEAEAVIIPLLQSKLLAAGVNTVVSDRVPAQRPDPLVVVATAGSGSRQLFTKTVPIGVSVYAADRDSCRILSGQVADALSQIASDVLSEVNVNGEGYPISDDEVPGSQRYIGAVAVLRPLVSPPSTYADGGTPDDPGSLTWDGGTP